MLVDPYGLFVAMILFFIFGFMAGKVWIYANMKEKEIELRGIIADLKIDAMHK